MNSKTKSIDTNKNIIKVEGHSEKVSCNGEEGDLGHPKIYLVIDSKRGSVTCPYCGKLYKKKSN